MDGTSLRSTQCTGNGDWNIDVDQCLGSIGLQHTTFLLTEKSQFFYIQIGNLIYNKDVFCLR